MKKPYYLMYTTSQTHDIDPIDHGHILQPEHKQDRMATISSAGVKLAELIPWVIGIGFVVLTFVLAAGA